MTTNAAITERMQQVHHRALQALELLRNENVMPDLTSIKDDVEAICFDAQKLPRIEQEAVAVTMRDVITTFDELVNILQKQQDWLTTEIKRTSSSAHANKAYLKAKKDDAP
jgi:hypothetical protein